MHEFMHELLRTMKTCSQRKNIGLNDFVCRNLKITNEAVIVFFVNVDASSICMQFGGQSEYRHRPTSWP